ncbi:acyl-CoA dehydrogenase family protein [Alkalimarinus alittae]|uniref:Acyl-CoA dehydrogenase family protein n=1 Tax=Alkalimarinus alittae TaxID=2961619 RepID=A0ABY6N0X8_9ALTE|nr:acyl-CoA dehydrogenase family protein [Alkalimarinus alittae]UZE95662.1 acyl-CoA dehydrogenase family protein [Alkalimarinus alittae]
MKNPQTQHDRYFAHTHVVENQPPELENINLFEQDTALKEAVKREGAGWAAKEISQFGQAVGQASYIELGFQANENKPVLHTHDRFGHRVDHVKFHPAYHQLMRTSIENGLHSSPWTDPKAGAHVARSAKCYLQTQVESAHGCPITMTFASIPSLRRQPNLDKIWTPLITARKYDETNRPFSQKEGVTIGMAMTEKQGGSDVRANSTKAYPVGQPGGGELYELVGHKYFVSAPMCDAFLVLAQAPSGLSCFLVPRWNADGSKNPLQVLRLKDKMGNVANASSETELRGALGWMVGEEGQGVRTIIEMVSLTRFDCMMGSSSGQRLAVAHATHHCHYRSAFGAKLDQQPLMQNVLADLALEQEGSLAFTMRMARALDNQHDESEQLLMRLGTAVGKYWICKRTPNHAYEAMECIGGSGVMENSIFPRMFRESPINAIWEGSGNVQCLDVLRVMYKTPAAIDAFFNEVDKAKGENSMLDQYVRSLKQAFTDLNNIEYRARNIVDRLALAFQSALLVQSGNHAVSDLFCASRLSDNGGHNIGSMPASGDCASIIERARPNLTV